MKAMDYKTIISKLLLIDIQMLISLGTQKCLAVSSGHGVWEYLFLNNTYNSEVRPVKVWSTSTDVNVSVAVIAVVDFNEVKQTIILTTKLTLSWKDEYLVWDPQNFENITHIHVSQSKVWKPYVFLENSVSKQYEMGTHSVQVIVSYDGTVEWNPVEVFHSTCAADVRKFPFDTQKCSMVFESLGYTTKELRIHSVEDHVDFHGYGATSGWYVVDTDMEAKSEEGAEIHILCSLTLKRNPTFFILNVFLPIVILSFMNICVFILPVQSGEKASFVITVFLSLAVFLTIVSGNLPENSDKVSILNVYVFICTLLSVIIAILTIIQIRIYHRDADRSISPFLVKLVAMFTSKQGLADDRKKNVVEGNDKDKRRKNATIDVLPQDGSCNLNDQKPNDEICKINATWPDVVRAFDNIFLVVFLVTTIIMTVTVLIMAVRNEELAEEHDSH
ncbi:acetylcholine receptor subunit alpha-1-A-like [Mercenaria mercenaria]|uniref:acetylcholine receptor subunit alpha-1-A-like n=1 Tax=Mercenaria mercenaria TaxID=6596 RepID=UPI00234F0D39|nr:acetylcholine receptor subunit alpha-1-A-like [Mercenaria mercenaria]